MAVAGIVTPPACAVPVQAAGVDLLDQGREGHVELRQALAALAEVVGVVVPAAEGQGHAPGAGLDQATGHQELVVAAGTAVVDVGHVAVAVPGPQLRVSGT